jgi:hypothetical protein
MKDEAGVRAPTTKSKTRLFVALPTAPLLPAATPSSDNLIFALETSTA